MKNFKADYVYPVFADPIKNGIVTVDDAGKIAAVIDPVLSPEAVNIPVEQVSGIICPGFVNTHCHLELSHLEGKLPQHTGLVDFIINVQKHRNADPGFVTEMAIKADADMYDNGIVAVGDIANTNSTVDIKAKSSIYYHSFIETFGFLPERANEVFEKALDLLGQFKPQASSIVPHAPYSVSKELFKLIQKYSETGGNLITMHNQESDEENKFFRYKLGRFNDLYSTFGIDISYFKPQARNSLQSVLSLLSENQKILLVHNTCTNLKDIYFVKRFDRQIHFCFCPNANLYIGDMLPKVELFIGQGYDITLGTDSLASNQRLDILSEMRTIQNKFPSISLQQLIEWGSINGARFLGIDDEKGTIEPGKTPGLNLITGLDGTRITPETKVKRLV